MSYSYFPINNRTFADVIELNKHIEILLLSNDCVIVPGLGGFMAHHMDARFDKTDNTFLPPLRTLGFNPQLTMNDSLLVQSYIEAFDMSYPEALRRIETEVSELKLHLETDGYYELTDIGTLKMNAEGKIEFEPCEAGILTPYYYGLSSFQMTPIIAEQPIDAEDAKSAETITIKMSWIRNTAAAAAAVVAFFMVSTPISNNTISTEPQQSAFIALPQSIQEEPVMSNIKKDDAHINIATDCIEEAPKAEATAKDTVTIQEPVIVPTEEAKATMPAFCIVMASQVTERNANTYIEQLQKEHLTQARMITNKNNMRRVVYGNYTSEDEAMDTLRMLRSQSQQFTQAWVMEIKD